MSSRRSSRPLTRVVHSCGGGGSCSAHDSEATVALLKESVGEPSPLPVLEHDLGDEPRVVTPPDDAVRVVPLPPVTLWLFSFPAVSCRGVTNASPPIVGAMLFGARGGLNGENNEDEAEEMDPLLVGPLPPRDEPSQLPPPPALLLVLSSPPWLLDATRMPPLMLLLMLMLLLLPQASSGNAVPAGPLLQADCSTSGSPLQPEGSR